MHRYTTTQRSALTALAILAGVVVVALGVVGIARLGADRPTTTTSTIPTSTAPVTTTSTPAAGSATTSSTSTTVATTTSTTLPLLARLVLEPDGLGEIDFGATIGDTIDVLIEALGDPSEDSGWIESSSLGPCPGNRVRVLRWRSLQAFFSDGPTEWAPAGIDHFFAYTNSAAFEEELVPLATDAGVMVGSNVSDLRDAYGDSVAVENDEAFGPVFTIDVPGAGLIWGPLEGTSDGDRIIAINGGIGCGE